MENLYKYLKDVPTINPNVAVSLAIADASDDTEDATAVAADIKEGKTAYIATGKVTGTFKGVDTSDATAAAGDLLDGKTAYVKGSKIVGTIVSKEAQTYTPSSSEQVINAGQYLAGAQTIAAVPTEEKSATPSTAEQEVVPTAGKFLSKVTVGGDANLVADNIKNGVSIFGVQGTLTSLDTSDADATAENIDSGKTAYVKGQKITGTSTKVNTSDATATEGQILSGKTAYVNGEKVTGTLSFGTTLTRQGNLSVSDNNVVTAMTVLDSNFCIYSDNSVPKQAKLTLTASQVAESIGLTADKLVTGNTILGIAGTATTGIDTSDANATAADIATGKTAYVNGQKITGTHTCAPTVVTAVYKGKVKDTSDITLQVDYRTVIMQNNFEFEGYTLAEGDVIMFPDNNWVSAVVATGGVEICNHSKSNEYALKGKECYVMSKAQVIQ